MLTLYRRDTCTYLDANVHWREANKWDFVGGNLPENDGKTVHVSCPLVNVLRSMLQCCVRSDNQYILIRAHHDSYYAVTEVYSTYK
jgi:hypothetical protein